MIFYFLKYCIEFIVEISCYIFVFLLSNMNEFYIIYFICLYREIVGELVFEVFFWKVYYLFEVGMCKFYVEIFELVIWENNFNLVRMFFIDDFIQYIEGVVGMGLQIIYLVNGWDIYVVFF